MSILVRPAAWAASRATLPALWPWRTSQSVSGQRLAIRVRNLVEHALVTVAKRSRFNRRRLLAEAEHVLVVAAGLDHLLQPGGAMLVGGAHLLHVDRDQGFA